MGPEAVAQYVNVGEYFKRRAASLGIKTNGLVKSQEEMQAEAQQMQQAALMEKAAPRELKRFLTKC